MTPSLSLVSATKIACGPQDLLTLWTVVQARATKTANAEATVNLWNGARAKALAAQIMKAHKTVSLRLE